MRKNAFTLIELLVVIAIIAILAAILFPVFAQARNKARGAASVSNCKQIGTAMMMYVQDYDETYPSGWDQSWASESGTDRRNGLMMWRVSLLPYIQKYKLDPANLYNGNNYNAQGVLNSPNQPGTANNFGPTGYGYNMSGSGTGGPGMTGGWQGKNCADTNAGGCGHFPGSSLAAIAQPANMVAFGDAAEFHGNLTRDPNFNTYSCAAGTAGTPANPFPFSPELWKESWSCDWGMGVPCRDDFSGNDRRPAGRYNNQFTAVFADGHVKMVQQKVLKTMGPNNPASIFYNQQ